MEKQPQSKILILRKMFLRFTIAVLSIYFIDFHEICRIVCEWHWQCTLQISWTSLRYDAEHCDDKLWEHFPQFLTTVFFHPTLQLSYHVASDSNWNNVLQRVWNRSMSIRGRNPLYRPNSSLMSVRAHGFRKERSSSIFRIRNFGFDPHLGFLIIEAPHLSKHESI